jgi:DNA-binding MarR family transcriptional regulator
LRTPTPPASAKPPTQLAAGFGSLARRTHRAYARALALKLDELGLTIGQFQLLRVLLSRDGLTQRELSDSVEVKKGALTALFNRLESEGYVHRMRDPDDVRKVNVFLTPKSKALRQTLIDLSTFLNRTAKRGIPAEDVRTATVVLNRMIENLRPLIEPQDPD